MAYFTPAKRHAYGRLCNLHAAIYFILLDNLRRLREECAPLLCSQRQIMCLRLMQFVSINLHSRVGNNSGSRDYLSREPCLMVMNNLSTLIRPVFDGRLLHFDVCVCVCVSAYTRQQYTYVYTWHASKVLYVLCMHLSSLRTKYLCNDAVLAPID